MKNFSKLFLLVATMLLALNVAPLYAQKAEIYPLPQDVEWNGQVAFPASAAYTIVGESSADADAVALFKKNFTTGGAVQVIMGERGDAAIAEYESLDKVELSQILDFHVRFERIHPFAEKDGTKRDTTISTFHYFSHKEADFFMPFSA